MPSPTTNPFRLGVFWLGIQAVWGAVLGISLQARTIELTSASTALVAFGRLATIGAIVAAVAQVAVGPWSDRRRRHGSRRLEFYTIGSIAGAIAIVLFYGAANFGALSMSFVIMQAALNVATGPYQAVIPDSMPRERFGIASSWMAALQSAGNAIGAMCAAFISQARLLGATLAVLVIGCGAFTSLHLRSVTFQAPPARERIRITRAFIDLFISRALVYVGFYTLLGYLLFYVNDTLGASSISAAKTQSGVLILAFTVMGVAGAAAAARPSDRHDQRVVATVGGAIVMAALAVFVFSHGWVPALFATLMAGAGWGVFLVADWAIVCRILPPGALATTMGIWNLALIGPQIVAPALTTGVLRYLGLTSGPQGPRIAFVLALCETFVGIMWLWRLSRSAIAK